MPAKITYEIPQSNAELTCTAIASVLKEELENQYVITNNSIFDLSVDEERFRPYSEGDLIRVTVHQARADNQNSNPEFERFKVNYYIRTTVKYIETEGEEGSQIAQKIAKKIGYVIRYILKSRENYQIHESIESTKVLSIEMADPFREDTARNETASQVLFEVTLKEESADLELFDVDGADVNANNFKTTI